MFLLVLKITYCNTFVVWNLLLCILGHHGGYNTRQTCSTSLWLKYKAGTVNFTSSYIEATNKQPELLLFKMVGAELKIERKNQGVKHNGNNSILLFLQLSI